MNEPESTTGVFQRFPALNRLANLARRRRMPFVPEPASKESGVACLSMTLALHGKQVAPSELRPLFRRGTGGAIEPQAMLEVAATQGLRGRGLALSLDDLSLMPAGCILQWDFTRFVVLDRLLKDGLVVIDPAQGPRLVPLDQARLSFTGVALHLEPGEHFTQKPFQPVGIWQFLFTTLLRSGVWVQLLLASVVLQLLGVAYPLFMGLVLERIVPMADARLLFIASAGLATVVLFVWLLSYVRGHLLLVLQTKVDLSLSLGTMEHLLTLPLSFFHQRSKGDILQRWQASAELRDLFASLGLAGVLDAVMVLFYVLALLAVSPASGAVALLLALAQMGVFLALRGTIGKANVQAILAEAKAFAYGTEVLGAIETLKVSGAEQRALERWSSRHVEAINAFIRRERVKTTSFSVLGAMRALSPLVVLAFGASQVLDGRLSMGSMLAIVTFAAGFLVPFSGLIHSVVQLQISESHLRRLDELHAALPEQDRSKTRPPGRLRGSIQLRRVSFRYGPTLPDVVRGVDAEVKAGQFIALVGRSGSGKSSLASLLLGLYRPTQGKVFYDGTDLGELNLRMVRQQLGIVPQAPMLFNDSIRANICGLDPSIGLDQVVQAAKAACIHEDIKRMPLGYDTQVTEGGASLSGGQRQRIALARALLRKPAVLLLDEATSALDAVTERAVQESLVNISCTKFFITHSLPTIARAEEIWVMDEGALVERGQHLTLLSRGTVYPSLVKAVLSGGELLRP